MEPGPAQFAIRTTDPLALVALDQAQENRFVLHHAVPGGHLPITLYKSDNWMADCDYARVFGYPKLGLIKVDCRLAALLEQNDGTQKLAPPHLLVKGAEAARQLAARILGLSQLDGTITVQRVDLTADLRFKEPSKGQEFVWAMAHLKLPRYNEVPHQTKDPRVMEGVEWKTESNHTHARIYDKGLQRKQKKLVGAEDPGNLIRVERQMTFAKAKQPSAQELATSNLRRSFLGAFQPFIDGSGKLAICGQLSALEVVRKAHEEGQLAYPTARRLSGDLLNGQVYGPNGFPSTDASQRFDRELRKLGIRFDRKLMPTVRVQVGPILEAAAKCWPSPDEKLKSGTG